MLSQRAARARRAPRLGPGRRAAAAHPRRRRPTQGRSWQVRHASGPPPRCSPRRCSPAPRPRDRSQLATELQTLGAGLSASIDADRLALVGSVLAPNLRSCWPCSPRCIHTATYPKREVVGRARAARRASWRSPAASRPSRPGRRCWPGCTASIPTRSELPVAGGAGSRDGQAVARRCTRQTVSPKGAVLTLVGRSAPGRRARRGRGSARRLDGPRRQAAAQASQARARRGHDRRPAGRGADQHPAGRPGAAAYRAELRRAAGRQRRLRRLLLLAAGQQHPRGQGLHLLAAQLDRARGRRVAVHRRGRRRHRGHRSGAAGDPVRAGQGGVAAAR